MNLEDIIVLSLNDPSVELLHYIVHILIQQEVKSSIGICRETLHIMISLIAVSILLVNTLIQQA